MLTRFLESSQDAISPPLIPWLRVHWRKSLDKGKIPTTTELADIWRRQFSHDAEAEIACWVEGISGDWVFQSATADVREIFCHSPELIESLGDHRLPLTPLASAEDWELWIETLAVRAGAEYNYSRPCCSARLSVNDKPWRLTLLHSSVTPQGHGKAFLRSLSKRHHALSSFGLDAVGESLLHSLIHERENVLVAGATGSGKTSFLNTMLGLSQPQDHLVVLEDTQEIQLESLRVTHLLASTHPGRSLCDYLTYALRLSPDRLALGEMRSHEVVPYLLAMNTGHRGLLSTLHASSPIDAVLRVAQLFVLASGHKDLSYQEVLRLVSRNVGHVIYLEGRKVKSIIRILGIDEAQPLYDEVWSCTST